MFGIAKMQKQENRNIDVQVFTVDTKVRLVMLQKLDEWCTGTDCLGKL